MTESVNFRAEAIPDWVFPPDSVSTICCLLAISSHILF